MYPDVRAVQKRIEDSYEAAAPQIEARALEAYKENPAKAVAMLTAYSDSCAMSATDSYRKLGEYLLVAPLSPGYNENYYRRVVESDTTGWLKVRK